MKLEPHRFKRAVRFPDGSVGSVSGWGLRLSSDWAAIDCAGTRVYENNWLMSGWCLIHLPTGLAACYWPSVEHCQTVADWFEAEGFQFAEASTLEDFTPEQCETWFALREEAVWT